MSKVLVCCKTGILTCSLGRMARRKGRRQKEKKPD